MDVSIIFINYKTKDLTINAINSVIEKTEGLEYEIFVVDNNSQDGSIEAIEKEFPNINIIKNPINAGFGAANNLAIKKANGKYIFCLNTDTLLVNNAIKLMFDFMEKEENQNVGVCGGLLYTKDMSQAMSYCVFPNIINSNAFHWLLGYLFPSSKNKKINCIQEVDAISGADIFFRKSVLEKVGLFDERFFMYFEEMDLCFRIKKQGYSIKINPEAKIIHLEGKSTSGLLNNAKLRVISKYKYARVHQSIITIFTIKFTYILFHIIGYLFSFKKQHIELIFLHWKG